MSSGVLIDRLKPLFLNSFRRSIKSTLGIGRSSTRRGNGNKSYWPVLARNHDSSAGRCRSKNDTGVIKFRPLKRDRACMITGHGFLLECRFMLFIDDDQTQMGKGEKMALRAPITTSI